MTRNTEKFEINIENVDNLNIDELEKIDFDSDIVLDQLIVPLWDLTVLEKLNVNRYVQNWKYYFVINYSWLKTSYIEWEDNFIKFVELLLEEIDDTRNIDVDNTLKWLRSELNDVFEEHSDEDFEFVVDKSTLDEYSPSAIIDMWKDVKENNINIFWNNLENFEKYIFERLITSETSEIDEFYGKLQKEWLEYFFNNYLYNTEFLNKLYYDYRDVSTTYTMIEWIEDEKQNRLLSSMNMTFVKMFWREKTLNIIHLIRKAYWNYESYIKEVEPHIDELFENMWVVEWLWITFWIENINQKWILWALSEALDKWNMSPEQKALWKSVWFLWIVAWWIFAAFKFFKKTWWKWLLWLIWVEFASNMATWKWLFHLTSALMSWWVLDELDSMWNWLRKLVWEDLERAKNNEKFLEIYSTTAFMNMLFWEYKISEIRNFVKKKNDWFEFDRTAFENNIWENNQYKLEIIEEFIETHWTWKFNETITRWFWYMWIEPSNYENIDWSKRLSSFYKKHRDRSEILNNYLDWKSVTDEGKVDEYIEQYLEWEIDFEEFKRKVESYLEVSNEWSRRISPDNWIVAASMFWSLGHQTWNQEDWSKETWEQYSWSQQTISYDTDPEEIIEERDVEVKVLSRWSDTPIFNLDTIFLEESPAERSVWYVEDWRGYMFWEDWSPEPYSYSELSPEMREKINQISEHFENLQEDISDNLERIDDFYFLLSALVNSWKIDAKVLEDYNFLVEKYWEELNDIISNPSQTSQYQKIENWYFWWVQNIINEYKIHEMNWLDNVYREFSSNGDSRKMFFYNIVREKLDWSSMISTEIVNERFDMTWISQETIDALINALPRRKSEEWLKQLIMGDDRFESIRDLFSASEIDGLVKELVEIYEDFEEKEWEYEEQIYKEINENPEYESLTNEEKDKIVELSKQIFRESFIRSRVCNSIFMLFVEKTDRKWDISITSDNLIKLFKDIHWIWGFFEWSDSTMSISWNIVEFILIEAVAIAAWAVTMWVWTWVVNALAWWSRWVKWLRRMNRIREWRSFWARAWRFLSHWAIAWASFHFWAAGVHNLFEWRDWFEWMDESSEWFKTIFFMYGMSAFNHLFRVLPGIKSLYETHWNGFITSTLKLWTTLTIEWAAISALAPVIWWIEIDISEFSLDWLEISFEPWEWTPELLIQWIMFAAMFRWMWYLWNNVSKLRLVNRNWTIEYRQTTNTLEMRSINRSLKSLRTENRTLKQFKNRSEVKRLNDEISKLEKDIARIERDISRIESKLRKPNISDRKKLKLQEELNVLRDKLGEKTALIGTKREELESMKNEYIEGIQREITTLENNLYQLEFEPYFKEVWPMLSTLRWTWREFKVSWDRTVVFENNNIIVKPSRWEQVSYDISQSNMKTTFETLYREWVFIRWDYIKFAKSANMDYRILLTLRHTENMIDWLRIKQWEYILWDGIIIKTITQNEWWRTTSRIEFIKGEESPRSYSYQTDYHQIRREIQSLSPENRLLLSKQLMVKYHSDYYLWEWARKININWNKYQFLRQKEWDAEVLVIRDVKTNREYWRGEEWINRLVSENISFFYKNYELMLDWMVSRFPKIMNMKLWERFSNIPSKFIDLTVRDAMNQFKIIYNNAKNAEWTLSTMLIFLGNSITYALTWRTTLTEWLPRAMIWAWAMVWISVLQDIMDWNHQDEPTFFENWDENMIEYFAFSHLNFLWALLVSLWYSEHEELYNAMFNNVPDPI